MLEKHVHVTSCRRPWPTTKTRPGTPTGTGPMELAEASKGPRHVPSSVEKSWFPRTSDVITMVAPDADRVISRFLSAGEAGPAPKARRSRAGAPPSLMTAAPGRHSAAAPDRSQREFRPISTRNRTDLGGVRLAGLTSPGGPRRDDVAPCLKRGRGRRVGASQPALPGRESAARQGRTAYGMMSA